MKTALHGTVAFRLMRRLRRFICSVNPHHCSDSSPCLLVHLAAATPRIYLFVHFLKNLWTHWSATSGGMNNLSRGSRTKRKLIRRFWGIVGNAAPVSGACLQELIVSKDADQLHGGSCCCFLFHHLLFLNRSVNEDHSGLRKSFADACKMIIKY